MSGFEPISRVDLKKTRATHYCARSSARNYTKYSSHGKNLSVLGNPFHTSGGMSKDEVIIAYRQYLDEELDKFNSPVQQAFDVLLDDIGEDGMITLGCFCGLNETCHVDAIIDKLEELIDD